MDNEALKRNKANFEKEKRNIAELENLCELAEKQIKTHIKKTVEIYLNIFDSPFSRFLNSIGISFTLAPALPSGKKSQFYKRSLGKEDGLNQFSPKIL